MQFPVLMSRVQVQYPVLEERRSTFPEAESPGGARWRCAADAPRIRRWVLLLRDLTDGEAAALRDLYEACSGGWRSFLFADPLGNLLRWSEDPGNAAWGRSAGLSVSRLNSMAETPAEFEILNASSAPGRLFQDLPLPAGALICFSCEAQGEALKLRAGGAEAAWGPANGWVQRAVTGESGSGATRAELELAPGASVRVRCMQAEIQLSPSAYQATYENGGIHWKTRFGENGLRITAIAPGRHEAEVRLESVVQDGV